MVVALAAVIARAVPVAIPIAIIMVMTMILTVMIVTVVVMIMMMVMAFMRRHFAIGVFAVLRVAPAIAEFTHIVPNRLNVMVVTREIRRGGAGNVAGRGVETVTGGYADFGRDLVAGEFVIQSDGAVQDADRAVGVDDVFGADDGSCVLGGINFKMGRSREFVLRANHGALEQLERGVADGQFAGGRLVQTGELKHGIRLHPQNGAAVRQEQVNAGRWMLFL